MRRRPDLAIVIGFVAVAATLILVSVNIWLVATGPTDTFLAVVNRVLLRLQPLPYGPVGLLIATRRRGNTIAWILIALGLAVAASGTAGEALTGAVDPITTWLLGVANDVGYLLLVALGGALVLLYPDGRLPSRRWWPVGAALAAWIGLTLFVLIFAPSIPHERDGIPNPFAVPAVVSELAQLLTIGVVAVVIPLLLSVAAAAIARWRRSTGVERQQLELLVYAASFVALGYVLTASGLPGPWSAFIDVAHMGVPVAIAVAVFRYRLYDIDVLINRTLVYGATTALIGVAFFGGIVVLQALLRPFTAGSEVAVAGSTLASVALFQPLRARIQGLVDRRFYRARYDATHTLDAFSLRLRDEVDLDAVRGGLIDAVHHTVQPTHASVWLRDGRT
jgi:hypothetical protein